MSLAFAVSWRDRRGADMTAPSRTATALALVLLSMAVAASAQIRLVNMVPKGRSGETNQDAEPTITVGPQHRSHIAGSAFTSDNLTKGPNAAATAPIYVSHNNANTRSLAFTLRTKIGARSPTGTTTRI